MKKRKALKSAVLVGLSAVLVGGIAMTAAGCGGKRDPNEIVVSMFSSNADRATNQKIADDWAAEYNAANNTQYTVKISNKEDKTEYFNKLADEFTNKTIGDVMYLAPSNVKFYARSGRVIDLTPYIAEDTKLADNIDDVWPNALNYYGLDTTVNAYIPDPTGEKSPYTMGQSIEYNKDGANGAGFYTAADKKVGLYGLPKDYSNFSMGFNRVYFSDAMKKAYTTTMVNAQRTVKGAKGDTDSNSSNITYDASTGGSGANAVITYAVGGSYTNPYDGDNVITCTAGQPARIINPGIPVNIKPFNFYMWKTFDEAKNAGDPIAYVVDYYTQGRGYTVTIPGFPDETFEIPNSVQKDPNAPYDTSMGHITYTYAEYGALMWSLTYYLNTFAWDEGQNPLNGNGGIKDSAGNYRTVYGGEQYEGGAQDGFQLYVLPWLFSNDADLINSDSTLCVDNTKKIGNTNILDSANITVSDPKAWADYAGVASETVKKLRLNGEYENVDVQYGLNSQKFIETYAAFLAIGSDWNGNPNDSPVSKKENSGWGYFRAGRSIFYGAGTWDSAVRNEEDKKDVDLGQMPTPVAERYALYSYIKDANYNMVTYQNNGNDKDHGTAATPGKATLPIEPFSQEQIEENQLYRQDKWGARMDSVGYAVTCMSLEGNKPFGAPTAKTKAAASLCAALTVSAKPQVSLTYGGAQLPNFISQCEELVHFQDKEYFERKVAEDPNYERSFEDMITFDGDADGNDVWDQYYAYAKAMGDAAYQNKGGTVEEFLAGKKITLKDGSQVDVKYDPDFAKTTLDDASFARADSTAKSRYSFAMKVLRMVAFRKSDFDLLIRMQYGLNSVRDSSMYTYNDNWLYAHDARDASENNLCYYRARNIAEKKQGFNLAVKDFLKRSPDGTLNGTQFVTPFVWCMMKAKTAQDSLDTAIDTEQNTLAQAGIYA